MAMLSEALGEYLIYMEEENPEYAYAEPESLSASLLLQVIFL